MEAKTHRGKARVKHSGRLRRLPVGGMIVRWQPKRAWPVRFYAQMRRDYGEPA